MRRMLVVMAVLLAGRGALAGDGVRPLWIETGDPPPPANVTLLPTILRTSGIALLMGAAVTTCAHRRRLPDDADVAFDTLAAMLDLDADDRGLVREMSASRIPPVALLVSQDACRRSIARFRRRQTDPGVRAHLHRLEAKLLA